jgi:anti-sigma regulatory factor (Ser/Thr protein kinase)
MLLFQETFPDLHEALECQLDFGADFSQSKIIRDIIGRIFDAHGIGSPWRGRLILITDELINNAIEHGSALGDLDSCIIQASRRADGSFALVIEVHDTGNGKDAKDAAHMDTIKMDHLDSENKKDGVYTERRGRGLFYITEKLVDRLSFATSPRGGLAVKIEKNISVG